MIYVPGLLAGQLSGKAGNTLASSGPYGPTLTVKRASSTPITPAKSAVQNNFAATVAAYRALSPTDLAAWKALGQTMFVIGRLHRTYTLTGIDAFLSVNRWLHTIGSPGVTTAPSLVRPPSATISVVTAVSPVPGGGTLTFDVDIDPIPLDTKLVVYGVFISSTAIQEPARRSWKVIQVFNTGDIGPYDVTTTYGSIVGGFNSGDPVWLKVVPVSDEGFPGAGSQLSAIAT